jgi:hypothetical protein
MPALGQKRTSNPFDPNPFGEDLRPRALVVGDLNHVGLLKLVLYIKLGATRVVDVPAISVKRYRNVFSNVPELCMCSG